MNKFIFIVISLSTIVLTSLSSHSSEQETIRKLTAKIKTAQTEKEKSTLYIYRARHYNILGKYEEARDDYDIALTYNHNGWIHLERW